MTCNLSTSIRGCLAPLARCAVLMALAAGGLLHGQRISSDILGSVRDPSGAFVPEVPIKLVAVETGVSRETLTGPDGYFHVAGLPPGRFDVHVTKHGFAETVVHDVEVTVNQQVTLDISLELAGARTVVEVQASSALIESANANLSGVVGETTLRELPLNGRDLTQLTLLQTGVAPSTNAGPSPWGDGGVSKAAVQGTRPSMNNLNLDGSDINDPGFNIPTGGVTGMQMGVEAVREFRVLLNSYSAEFGRNAGANIQLVTKSGTNSFHGSMYEFLRNAALDARNFFDGRDTPPFVRNQFGASLGGPLQKNLTFFFLNYEGLEERKSITTSLSVPDLNAHAGLLPSAANPNLLINVGVDPLIAPYMQLYPLPNGPSRGGGIATLNTTGRQPTRSSYGMLRLDHHWSRNVFVTRYVIDDSVATVPFLSTNTPGFPGNRQARNHYGLLGWGRSVSPALYNDFKLAFNRTRYNADVDNKSPLSISLVPQRPLGVLNVGGLPALGNNILYPFGSASSVFEVIENAFYHRGSNLLKFGANFKRTQVNSVFDLYANGLYFFSDLTPFGFPSQSANPALEFFLRATPLVYFGVDPRLADSRRGFRQSYWGLYVQDDIRVNPRLTVNLGMRWEYWSNPTEANGRIANVRNLYSDKAATVGPIWDSVPPNQFSPRLGFAWTPTADGKTVVRGAAGLLRDQIWSNLYSNVRFYEPFYRPLQYILPAFRSSPAGVDSVIGLGGPPAVIGSFAVTYRPDFPYYLEYNLSVQHELREGWLLQVAYAGSRGIHLVRTGEANPFTPASGNRLNPNFGSVPLLVMDAQSIYHSGQLSLRRRLASGLQLQASYTFSKAIDDQSGAFPSDYVSESGLSQNLFNRKGDRGRSAFDRTHAFVLSGLYDLNFGRSGQAGKRRALLKGWSVGGILSAYSGVPFTATLGSFNNSGSLSSIVADRPDLRPGFRGCDATGDPNHWFDPAMFTLPAAGSYGNAGRNILCGPSLVNLDISLSKAIFVSERMRLSLRAEFFNLANRANFDVPINTQGPSGNGGNGDAIFIGRRASLLSGAPCTAGTDPSGLGCGVLATNAGQIFRTVTSSRQVQLALKLNF